MKMLLSISAAVRCAFQVFVAGFVVGVVVAFQLGAATPEPTPTPDPDMRLVGSTTHGSCAARGVIPACTRTSPSR